MVGCPPPSPVFVPAQGTQPAASISAAAPATNAAQGADVSQDPDVVCVLRWFSGILKLQNFKKNIGFTIAPKSFNQNIRSFFKIFFFLND